MSDLDFKPVVLRKSAPKKKTNKTVAQAQRTGDLSSVKKFRGGTQGKGGAGPNAWKIDQETADFRRAHTTVEFKQALMKARLAKKLSQKDLAQRLNQKATVIQQYENGQLVPPPHVISQLQRTLGVQLPKVQKPKKKKADE